MPEFEANRSIENNYIYHQSDINLNFKSHLHTSFEFTYVEDGCLTIIIDGKKYNVNAGNAVLILPNQSHSYMTMDYSKSYLCVFSISFAYEFYQSTRDKCVNNPIFKFEDKSLIDLLKSTKDEFLLKSIFYKIIYLFNNDKIYYTSDNKIHQIIEKIIRYSEENFDKDVSLKNFADKFAYSYNYLSNLINSSLNMNFKTLINMQRINHAKYLIQTTNTNLNEIAYLCGYKSIRSFNRNFKAIIGESPSVFMKKKYKENR